jgi:hypothetical protein
MNKSSNSSYKNSSNNSHQSYPGDGFKSNRNTSQTLDTEQNKLYEKVDTDGAHSGYVLGYN